MDKKYELIETSPGWLRVKALKDFTLITGETIKKGDFGGFVKSEDCLSHEGNCWVMNNYYICGKVSGNAIVKDFAEIYGCVTGNAIVKDFTFVGENATVTGNAVVQAYQRIHYGTVTADLLGTKDWTAALYAEFGIVPENGKVLLYTIVQSTENPKTFKSIYEPGLFYKIDKNIKLTDADEDAMNNFGKGLYFTTLEFIDNWDGNTILECEIDLKDIITVQFSTVRARKCRVLGIFKE